MAPARVRVIHREVIRKTLTLGDPEGLGVGEVDHPCHASGFGGQQHMPGAEHYATMRMFPRAAWPGWSHT
jgi:hypothetical protein